MDAIYINTNTFKVSGDKHSEFIPGRRIKADCGTIYYCTVNLATISGSYTVVTTKESNLTAGLTSVLYGIIEPGSSGSLPDHLHTTIAGSGGVVNRINDDLILYLTTSGSDTSGDGTINNPWKTFPSAWDYLIGKTINVGKSVTIKYLDGSHTVSGTITDTSHPCGSQITVSGETVLDRNITSVQSSSGLAGNYSVVFNINTASGVEIGDYAVVAYDAANGTNPSYACGCYEITNVDSINNRITINSKHAKGAPSGSVTASIKIFKTIINCSDGFIQVGYGSTLNLGNFVIVGTSTTDHGICAMDGGSLICSDTMGINGFCYAVQSINSSYINFNYCGASNSSSAIVLSYSGSTVEIYRGVVSASKSDNGVMAYYGSVISAKECVSTGNSSGNGYLVGYSSSINATSSSATGNESYGWRATYVSVVRRDGTVHGGNNSSGDTTTSYGSYIQI